MAQQSLYRRYRPQRFAELRGQDHVVRALRHAVASGTEGHGYLFSGPRGCGKTSTARILAKALNCTNLGEGEPCGECESCRSIESGQSYDLFELDAASNNGVDAMRDLIGRTAVGSPGRTKVYILDEVHMLSAAASNALLKTLEEPPEHVVFVLATTDPQKVLPTIRSRTQHFEFSLLSADDLTDYVNWVCADAGLDVPPDAVAQVVRIGRGSARDTLSALDRVAASGGVVESHEPIAELATAIADHDTGEAIAAIDRAIAQGIEPRSIGETLLAMLRDAFLVAVRADTPHLTDSDRERSSLLASRLGTASVTRGLELVGSALVDMRQASDPRIPLEVAAVRLSDVTADTSVAALLERIERLERGAAPTSSPTPMSSPAPTPVAAPVAEVALTASAPRTPPPPIPSRSTPVSAPAPAAPAPSAPAQEAAGELSVASVSAALAVVTEELRPVAKALYREITVTAVVDGVVQLLLANRSLMEKAEAVRPDVAERLERVLGQRVVLTFGAATPVSATPVSAATAAVTAVTVDEGTEHAGIVVADLADADVPTTGFDKLSRAFPGATIVADES